MKTAVSIAPLLLVAVLLQRVEAIEIVRLLVPKLVEDGKKGPFDLDCSYRCGEGDENLIVKWFFNNETTPFYQWIASYGEPIITGPYQAKFSFESDQHADTCNNKVSYKLALTDPEVAMSGLYRCEVQTFQSQDSAEANMVVFSPPQNFTLVIDEPSAGVLQVNCTVSPVYPIPEMKLFRVLKTDKEEKEAFDDVKIDSVELDGKVHQVSLLMHSSNQTLFRKQQLTFECDMAFREVKYQRFQRQTYTPKYEFPKKKPKILAHLPGASKNAAGFSLPSTATTFMSMAVSMLSIIFMLTSNVL